MGNSTDLKNVSNAPQATNDFPDAPSNSPEAKPQDKPDLDAFAKRIGTNTIETGEGLDAVPEDRSMESTGTKPRLMIGGAGVAMAALFFVVLRRRKKRGLLAKAVALGAAANVIRN